MRALRCYRWMGPRGYSQERGPHTYLRVYNLRYWPLRFFRHRPVDVASAASVGDPGGGSGAPEIIPRGVPVFCATSTTSRFLETAPGIPTPAGVVKVLIFSRSSLKKHPPAPPGSWPPFADLPRWLTLGVYPPGWVTRKTRPPGIPALYFLTLRSYHFHFNPVHNLRHHFSPPGPSGYCRFSPSALLCSPPPWGISVYFHVSFSPLL